MYTRITAHEEAKSKVKEADGKAAEERSKVDAVQAQLTSGTRELNTNIDGPKNELKIELTGLKKAEALARRELSQAEKKLEEHVRKTEVYQKQMDKDISAFSRGGALRRSHRRRRHLCN